jgi:peptide/nickel transport system substrate-binding protein
MGRAQLPDTPTYFGSHSEARNNHALRTRASQCLALFFFLAFAVLALLRPGGDAAAMATQASANPELRIGLTASGFPATLDPAKIGTSSARAAFPTLSNDPLIHLNQDGTYAPALATSWRYIGTGDKRFELTLRHGVRFSDGSKLNAEAVKTWLLYYSQAKGNYSTLLPISSIDTSGQWIVRVNLKSPIPVLPWVFAALTWGNVSSPNCVAHPQIMVTHSCGAGPYAVVPSQSLSGDHFTYVPNRFYYNKSKIRWSKVTVKLVSNASSMLQALQAGEFDVTYGDPTTADAASGAGFDIKSAPYAWVGVSLADRNGTLSKPLSDVRVRQALNYALDRKTITTALFGKYAQPTSSFGQLDAWDTKVQKTYPYDPDKAKALLAAAGYPNGFTFRVLTSAGFGTTGDPLAQAIAKYLAAVGVKLEITDAPTPSAVFSSLSSAPTHWLSGGIFDPMWFITGVVFMPYGADNPFKYSDPVINKAFLKAQRLGDKQAQASWNQILARVTTQAFLLPVMFQESIWYVSKKIGGVNYTVHGFVPDATTWFPK